MATCTIAKCLEPQPSVRHVSSMGINMTLKTKEPAFSPRQQVSFDSSVRLMTGSTSLHPQCRVFVDKRPAFFTVARNAGFEVDLPQLGGVQRSMGIMAVGTLHQTFRDAVVGGESKLSLYCQMTCKTELRLLLPEKAFVQPARFFGKRRDMKELLLCGPEPGADILRRRSEQVRRVALFTGNAH